MSYANRKWVIITLADYTDEQLENLVSNAIKNRFCKLIVTGEKKLGLMDGEKLGKILKMQDVSIYKINKDFNFALNELIDLVKKTNKPALILGSHYIAKPIFDKFGFYN